YRFPGFSSTEQCHAPLDHRKTPAPECAADHPETADATRQKSLWTGSGDNFYSGHQLWTRSNRLHRPHKRFEEKKYFSPAILIHWKSICNPVDNTKKCSRIPYGPSWTGCHRPRHGIFVKRKASH